MVLGCATLSAKRHVFKWAGWQDFGHPNSCGFYIFIFYLWNENFEKL